jgi:uncharacterized membrane protein
MGIIGTLARASCASLIPGLLLISTARAEITFATKLARPVALLTAATRAEITFCNKFAQPIFVAIAYQQSDQSWISRGWLQVDSGECKPFDSAIHVSVFYYRGETNWYDNQSGGRSQNTWGFETTKFAVVDSSFNFYNADSARDNARLAGFTRSVESADGDVSATVTFEADGHNTTVTTR